MPLTRCALILGNVLIEVQESIPSDNAHVSLLLMCSTYILAINFLDLDHYYEILYLYRAT